MTISVRVENTSNLRIKDRGVNVYTVDNGDASTKKLVNFRPLEFQDKVDVAIYDSRTLVIEEVPLGVGQGK